MAAAQLRGPLLIYDLARITEPKRIGVDVETLWLRFSPDGRSLALSNYKKGLVEIRDAETGQVTATLKHPQLVWCLDWHPDGKILATACFDLNIYIWDTVRTQQLAVLKGHTSAVKDNGSIILSSVTTRS